MRETCTNHWHREGRTKVCIRCAGTFDLGRFYAYDYTTRQGKRSVRYESRCKDCAKERRKERSAANPGMDAEQSRARRQAMPEIAIAYRKRRQATVEVKALKAYHQRLRKARLRSGQEDDPSIRAVYAEAMRIEKLIAVCPVFDLPELGKKMHVDHIVPLAKGGKHVASNLQVLPAGLNLRKGTTCPRFLLPDI